MPTISAINASLVIRGGVGTPAAPGRYVGFGTNANFTASTGPRIYAGTGNPNGVTVAPIGSIWLASNGVGGVFYNSDGGTTWVGPL